MKKHTIQLTAEQRQGLEAFTSKGQAPARTIKHAQILLKSDEGTWTDAQISQAFGVSEVTIWRVRRRFREHGLDEALNRRPQPERPEKRKVTGEQKPISWPWCAHHHQRAPTLEHSLGRKRVVELEIVEQVGERPSARPEKK